RRSDGSDAPYRHHAGRVPGARGAGAARRAHGEAGGRGRIDRSRQRSASMSRPAVFLDRDGTLIEERSYLADPDGVTLLPGVVTGLQALHEAGYLLMVVTNQAGIARGLIRAVDYERVRQRLDEMLARSGVALDGVYVCPHHPAITGPCDCRKPGLALYQQAAAEHDIDLARSAFIGDKPGDV